MISLVVAVTDNDVIGKENTVPWYLPADLAYFKQTTMGHPIIMGRRTHQSIGKTLPGRTNIIITRNSAFKAEGCIVAESLERAIEEAKKAEGSDKVFIIGGEEIYSQALPLADRIYLTLVHTWVQGDKFFKFDQAQWQEVVREAHNADDNNQYNYEFIVLERR